MAENELRRHKIRAELYDNLLTEDPSDFIARVVADKPAGKKEKRMENAVYHSSEKNFNWRLFLFSFFLGMQSVLVHAQNAQGYDPCAGIGNKLGSSTGATTKAKTRARAELKAPSADDIVIHNSNPSRSKQDIIEAINHRMLGLENVYNNSLDEPGFEGKISLKFTITPNGKTTNISIVSSTTGKPLFNEIIKDEVARWGWKAIATSGLSNLFKDAENTITVLFNFEEGEEIKKERKLEDERQRKEQEQREEWQRKERECKELREQQQKEQQEQYQKEQESLLAEVVKKKDYEKIMEICHGFSYHPKPQRCEEDVKKAEGEIKKLPLSRIKTPFLAEIYFEPSITALEYIQKPKMTKGYIRISGFEVRKIVNGNLAFGEDHEFYYIKFSKSNPLRAGMYGISGYGKPCPNVNGRACVELLWQDIENE